MGCKGKDVLSATGFIRVPAESGVIPVVGRSWQCALGHMDLGTHVLSLPQEK